MKEREPAEIGGRYRLTAAPAAPPPLEPLAAVDARTGAACEAWLVPPGLPGLDYGALGRAAAVFSGAGHPSLQDLHGVFAGPGGDYWVYEAPPGSSFEALAGEGRPFTEAQAADMAASLAAALKKLHGLHQRACHGSVSPRNIYLAGNGRPGCWLRRKAGRRSCISRTPPAVGWPRSTRRLLRKDTATFSWRRGLSAQTGSFSRPISPAGTQFISGCSRPPAGSS